MSLMSSLYTGETGLNAASIDLSTIGDNISNSDTIGFKSSRAAFEDALAQSMIGGSQLGLGTQLQSVQRIMTQGALATTGNATDLALDGQGFFIVKGDQAGQDGAFYTRDGQFSVDKNGDLVNLDGLQVQGYAADSTGALQPGLASLQVGDATSPPQATGTVTVKANLDADSTVPAAWDPTSPATMAATSNYSTSTTIYDSLGNAHTVDIYYRETAAGSWEWHAMSDGAGLTGGTAGTQTEIANGTLTFDNTGKLTASTSTSTFNPLGAINPQALTFNFGTAAPGGSGVDGITQFGSANAVTFVNQDGYAAGTLSSVSVDASGDVLGAFSNGQSRTLGQVAVANFSSPDQLNRVGGNLFQQTTASGDPAVGAAGSGGRGAIAAGSLEQSNVDMAQEFVKMIAAQRDFQANGKTISAADQLLQELMNMKR